MNVQLENFMIVSTPFETISEDYLKGFADGKNLKYADSSQETFINRLAIVNKLDTHLFVDRTSNIAVLERSQNFVGIKDLSRTFSAEFALLCQRVQHDAAMPYLSFAISKAFNFFLYCHSQNKNVTWTDANETLIDPVVQTRLRFYVDKNEDLLRNVILDYGLLT